MQPFFSCVLGKKNWVVFDQTTVYTLPEAVENVGNMPPAVGQITDRTQIVSSSEYKTTSMVENSIHRLKKLRFESEWRNTTNSSIRPAAFSDQSQTKLGAI